MAYLSFIAVTATFNEGFRVYPTVYIFRKAEYRYAIRHWVGFNIILFCISI